MIVTLHLLSSVIRYGVKFDDSYNRQKVESDDVYNEFRVLLSDNSY
jgi:hypothetical protein